MDIQTKTTLRIIIADDHQIFRDGFKLLLRKIKTANLLVVAEAQDGSELVELAQEHQPDMIFTDIQMPVMDGIEATGRIKKKLPDVSIIALSMFNQENLVLEMLQAGASGYLLKNTSKAELTEAIRIVTEGGVYFAPETTVHLTKTIRESNIVPGKPNPVKFSEREIEVIWHICKGFTNKEIAVKLNLSVRTIESHRENILVKTGTKNSVEVAVYAIKHGLIEMKDL